MKKQKALWPAQTTEDSSFMNELLADAFKFPTLRAGDVVDGSIVSANPSEILVDIGYKSDAVVDPHELEKFDRAFIASLIPGYQVVGYVVQPEDRDGNVVISLQRAQQEQDWRQAEELQKSADVFEGLVTGFNRGGVIIKVGRVRGFVPASQLSPRWQSMQDTDGDPEQRWAKLTGQTLRLKVVEMDRARNRLILSERAAARDVRKGQKDRLLTELKRGEVVTGVITSVADFGAFVDLGGADGLIHLSELAWRRIEHPSEVVRPGQEVQVYVLSVDEDRKRIGLSLRRMTPEPWSVIEQQFAVGQLLHAVITRISNFGAFAKMNDGIEGLIHISELADYRVSHPQEIVHEGDAVMVRVIRIDAQHRRIGLSLRQAAEDAYVEMDWRAEARAALADQDPAPEAAAAAA